MCQALGRQIPTSAVAVTTLEAIYNGTGLVAMSDLFWPMKRFEKRKRFPNERSPKAGVQSAMDRMRITLVALFPALWLLASGQSLADSCGTYGNPAPCNSTSTVDCSKPCPALPVCSPDISARPVRSRLSPQAGSGNLLPFHPVSPSYAFERTAPAVCAQREESPLALAASWQFACRAALDPRAPSFVS